MHDGPRATGDSAQDAPRDEERLAPHGRRVLAVLVDILVLPVHIVWLAFVGRWAFGLEQSTGFLVALLVIVGASLAVVSGTAVWLTGGQTLGKALVGLTERRVGRELTHDLRDLGWSLGRHSAGYLVIDVFGAGGVIALGTPRRRTLHDLAFGSEVLHAPGDDFARESWADRGRAFSQRLEDGIAASREHYGWVALLWRWQGRLILLVAGIVWTLANLLDKAGPVATSASASTPPASNVPAAAPVSAKVVTAIVVPTTLVTGATVGILGSQGTGYQNVDVAYNYGTVDLPHTQEIFLMQADGDDRRQLTDNDSWDGEPDLYHDRLVVFSSERDGNRSLYTMTAEGTDVRRLTDPAGEDRHPDWSSDGEHIAFTRIVDGRWTVWVVAADGSSPHALDIGGAPDWSPDGERIAFSSSRDGNADIYVMDADGSDVERLTRSDGIDTSPAWSPDGESLAFTRERDGNQEIYVIGADGSGDRRLTREPAYDRTPFWSSDGEKILFFSGRGLESGDEIWAMNPDGSDPVQLTHYNETDQ